MLCIRSRRNYLYCWGLMRRMWRTATWKRTLRYRHSLVGFQILQRCWCQLHRGGNVHENLPQSPHCTYQLDRDRKYYFPGFRYKCPVRTLCMFALGFLHSRLYSDTLQRLLKLVPKQHLDHRDGTRLHSLMQCLDCMCLPDTRNSMFD